MQNLKEDSIVVNQLYELSLHHIIAKVVSLASKLKLDEILSDEPISIEDVSRKLNISCEACWRFLRILDAYDVVSLTNMGVQSTLLTSHLNYIASPHIFDSYDCIREIEHALKYNTECYSKAYGESFYQHVTSSPDQIKLFTEWCTESMKGWMQSVFELYDFTKFQKVIDIGGGQGHFLASILAKSPLVSGELFDQPEVVKQSEVVFKEFNVEDRVTLVPGDFFKGVPSGADVYIICRTLLNWSNENALKILNNCYSAMSPGNTLLIVDFYIPEKSHQHYQRGLLSDFNLFALLNSKNRTMDEWVSLLESTKFSLKSTYVSKEDAVPEPFVPICIIEAAK